MRDGGLRLEPFFRPSCYDRLVGAARADHREGIRMLSERRWWKVAGWTKRMFAHARKPEWNAAAALADRALGSPPRLPAVKLSTLRDDPYALDAVALLSACEARYPAEFDGVRDYLRRVDAFYGNRWQNAQTIEPGVVRYRVPRLPSADG
jgi:rhamnosyltransferase